MNQSQSQQSESHLLALVGNFEMACNNLTSNAALRLEAEQYLQKIENMSQPYGFCIAVLGIFIFFNDILNRNHNNN